MRTIASATIAFGLVRVPVRLYAAAESSDKITFKLLHGTCGSRLKQQYVCTKDGAVVERADMVKGYEFAKEKFVTFSAAELEALDEPPLEAIEIAEFVRLSDVDTLHFDRRYLLGPDAGADAAYKLLAAALTSTGRVALCRFALRAKLHLAVIMPAGERLVLQQLFYATEVRNIADVELDGSPVDPVQLQLAQKLIKRMGKRVCNLAAFEDVGKQRMQEQVDRKVAGGEITAAPRGGGAAVVDLVEALKGSIAPRKRAPGQRRRGERAAH